ncbi:MAG: electron transfer flavoprotein subunit alpha/FixB family protein, partial [Actinomycetota bacterium]
MSVLALVDHDRGVVGEVARQALTLARSLAEGAGDGPVEAVVIGEGSGDVDLGGSVDAAWRVEHPLLTDYAPGAWGEALMQLAARRDPVAVVAPGTDRGNEVLANMAALSDLPMVANVTEVDPSRDPWEIVRVRWGGSLLERAELSAAVRLVSTAAHAFPPAPMSGGEPEVKAFTPSLDESHAVTRVAERVTVEVGTTLATAPVVVSGGRGVGGPEGFGPLEELAEL